MSAPRLLASILLLAPTLILVGSPQARADSSLCDAVAGNLIQNCGFEGSLTNGPGSVPTGWTVSQWTNADGVFGLNYPGYAGYVNSGYYALQIGNDRVSLVIPSSMALRSSRSPSPIHPASFSPSASTC